MPIEVFVPAGLPETFQSRLEDAVEMAGYKGSINNALLVATNDPDGETYRVTFEDE